MPAAAGPVARPVRHLVPREAGPAELLVGVKVLVGEIVVVRHRKLATGDPARQSGAGLDDQRVRRDVVGRARQGCLDGELPVLERLARSAIDEVEADLAEAGLA